MATSTPLEQQSLSAPERRRDESVLHWGAAVGGLVLASAIVTGVVAMFLPADDLDGWLGQDVAWEVADRLAAGAVLVAASAAVVTAGFVLADTAPPRALSWAALALAVLAWLSTTPWWWELAGGYAPFWFPVDTTLLIAVWLVLVGADVLSGGAWHRWLGVVTLLAGVAAGVAVFVGLWGAGPLTVWAVVFAVAQLAGPHPAVRERPVADPAGRAAVLPARHDAGTTAGSGRWHRTPGAVIRLLSGVGPPVAVAVTFLVGWQTVSQWPEAPYGDTSFAWMPMGVIMVCGVVGLVGLATLAMRTARVAAVCSTVFWLSTAWLYPAAFVGDGFPQSATGMMVALSLLSLLPTAIVWAWAAFGDTPAAPPSLPPVRARPMSGIRTDPASPSTGGVLDRPTPQSSRPADRNEHDTP